MAGQEVDLAKMSKAHQEVYSATLALYWSETAEATPRFTCSTTVIEKDSQHTTAKGDHYTLLTAGHCVLEEDGTVREGAKFFVAEEIAEKPELFPVSIVKAENNDKLDFALLDLETWKQYPVIHIDYNQKSPDIETKVYTVNYSLGLVKQVALGEVASDVMGKGAANGRCAPCEGRYMVHLFNGPGSSGASIIDAKSNKIVGIVELGWNGASVGTAAETMKAFQEFRSKPTPVSDPKVLSTREAGTPGC